MGIGLGLRMGLLRTIVVVESYMADIWAEDHGAVGDGTTSGQGDKINTALQAAYTAGGGVVRLGPGTFLADDEPVEIPSNVILTGMGMGATTIKNTSDFSIEGVRAGSLCQNGGDYWGLHNLKILGSKRCFRFYGNSAHINISNVWLESGTGTEALVYKELDGNVIHGSVRDCRFYATYDAVGLHHANAGAGGGANIWVDMDWNTVLFRGEGGATAHNNKSLIKDDVVAAGTKLSGWNLSNIVFQGPSSHDEPVIDMGPWTRFTWSNVQFADAGDRTAGLHTGDPRIIRVASGVTANGCSRITWNNVEVTSGAEVPTFQLDAAAERWTFTDCNLGGDAGYSAFELNAALNNSVFVDTSFQQHDFGWNTNWNSVELIGGKSADLVGSSGANNVARPRRLFVNGKQLGRHLQGGKSINFSAPAAVPGPTNTDTITVTGAAIGDPVQVDYGGTTIGGETFIPVATVTAANTVSVALVQMTGSAVDPGALTVNVCVTERPGELVTNGAFASDSIWTKGANSVITPPNLVISGTGDTYQSIAITEGISYVVLLDVTISAGSVNVDLGGTSGTSRTATGVYSQYLAAGSSDSNITISPSADFSGSVARVSVLRV